MKSRTKARRLALQILYEVDLVGHAPRLALIQRIEQENEEHPLDKTCEEFVTELVLGVTEISHVLDKYLAKYAPDWPFNEIAVIDRNILRIALWEFAVNNKTPIKVAINEAVELAKIFGSDSASRFINGVLGSLAEHQDELVQSLSKKSEV